VNAIPRTWTHPKRHEAHPGNLFPAAIAITKVLRSRGLTLVSYEAVIGKRETWVTDTDKGARWVTRRNGKWDVLKQEPQS
jgi:hypothetical protein